MENAKDSIPGCLAFATGSILGWIPAVVGIACFFSGPQLADEFYILLSRVFWPLVGISIILLVFAAFRKSRPFVGLLYILFSMVGAALFSVLAINMIAYHWGQHWVLLGLLGPGLPFFALIADIFTGDFAGMAYLAVCFAIVIAWRFVGAVFLN